MFIYSCSTFSSQKLQFLRNYTIDDFHTTNKTWTMLNDLPCPAIHYFTNTKWHATAMYRLMNTESFIFMWLLLQHWVIYKNVNHFGFSLQTYDLCRSTCQSDKLCFCNIYSIFLYIFLMIYFCNIYDRLYNNRYVDLWRYHQSHIVPQSIQYFHSWCTLMPVNLPYLAYSTCIKGFFSYSHQTWKANQGYWNCTLLGVE